MYHPRKNEIEVLSPVLYVSESEPFLLLGD
jgi:hypothetical protein